MQVNRIQPFFSKENIKSEAKTAGASGILSAGLTLALYKGKNPKNAVAVGLFAAGVSVAIGVVQKAIALHKASNNTEICKMSENYHNG